MIFKYWLNVKGNLNVSYHFENINAVVKWLIKEYPVLVKKYGELSVSANELSGELKIGSKCYVFGNGSNIYTILGIKEYEKNRYGFILDSGFVEEVHKCY